MSNLHKRRMRFTFTCGTCLNPFQSNRADAKSCSPACRKYWSVHQLPYPGAPHHKDSIDAAKYNPRNPSLPGMDLDPVVEEQPIVKAEATIKDELVSALAAHDVKTRSRALAVHKDKKKRQTQSAKHKNPPKKKKGRSK